MTPRLARCALAALLVGASFAAYRRPSAASSKPRPRPSSPSPISRPGASEAPLQLASLLARRGQGEAAERLLERTRAAAGRSPSEGARAAAAAIDTRLALGKGRD